MSRFEAGMVTAAYRRSIAPDLALAPRGVSDRPAESVQGARAADHVLLQAMHVTALWAAGLSLIGVALVARCF